jgi:carboxypeptidase C (cathepsin A)
VLFRSNPDNVLKLAALLDLPVTVVLDAGHMVPMDLPSVSLKMIRSFVGNEPFSIASNGLCCMLLIVLWQ